MKQLLTTIFLLGIAQCTHAQQVCGIYYDYDGVGQRVKRYYDCKTNNPSYPPHMNPPIKGQVFPNPTEGPVIVVTDAEVDKLVADIFDISSGRVASSNCDKCNHLELDIATQPPGSYIVRLTILKEGYDDREEGHTIIKLATQ